MHRQFTFANCLPLLATILMLAAPALASPASEECDIANRLAHDGIWDSAVMFYDKALALNPYYMPAIAGRAAALRHMHMGGDGTARHKRKVPKTAKIAHAAPPSLHKAPSPDRATTAVAPEDEALGTAPPADAVKQAASAPKVEKTSEAAPVDSGAKAKAVATPGASTAPGKDAATSTSTATSPAPRAKPSEEQTLDGITIPSIKQDTNNSSSDTTSGAQDSNQIHTQTSPSWLILAACATFAVIVVLTVWWLSPTMYAARQSQHKLKKIDRSSDEF